MSDILCATLRLGKTSVDDIKRINRHQAGAVSPAMSISVVCTQVPQEFVEGTYVFLWLGSDNNKGTPTEWKQGFKAVGRLKSISRGKKYNDESTNVVEIGYIFPDAVNRLDILREASEAYYWCSSMPVIGLDDHSNQTVRMIDETAERSMLKAFFSALESVRNEFKDDIIGIYPDFKPFFDFAIPNPKNDRASGSPSVVNEYQRAARILQNHVSETGFEIPVEKSAIQKAHDDFMSRFAPEKLAVLSDDEVLDAIFYTVGDNHDALCYWLEKNPDCREYFGSIEGGSAYKFGLFQKQDTGEWMTGSPGKPQILDADEALERGKAIRDALVEGARIVRASAPKTLEEYEKLDDLLKAGLGDAYYPLLWVHKYLAMVCPDKLSCFFSSKWQYHVLYSLRIRPSEKMYARSGQLAMVENYASWGYCEFANVLNDKFGYIKQFVRIGTSDGSGNYAAEWESQSVVGIGWRDTGSLEQYSAGDGLDKEAIASNLKIHYYPKDARTASRKAGELVRFYNTDSDTIFVAMDGEAPLALIDGVGRYFYDEGSDMPHRKPGKWHQCFGNGERLPVKSEGLRTSCVQFSEPDNLLYLYEKYYYGVDEAQDEDMDEESNKTAFRQWMQSQVIPEGDSNSGQLYKENSINQYVSNIANTPCPSKPGHSIFATRDAETVRECIRILDSREKKNNTQRSAIKKYLQFLTDRQLEEGEGEAMETDYFIEPQYYTGFASDYENNRIIFGAPGTGKSYLLKQEAEDLVGCAAQNMERVTFHTDYTYSQFVGAYKPVSDEDGKIRYDFVPGPFMRVYVNAIKNGQQIERVSRLIEEAEVMHMFPTNPNPSDEDEKWDLFEEIKEVGQTETFHASKDCKAGDLALIYVARTKPGYENGIYAIGTIVGKQRDDIAVIRFDYVSYCYPIIDYETLKPHSPNIRSNGRVNDEIMQLVKEAEIPANPYLLIIEEINRAKVAAVFGDVFQLLDRDEDGVSEYAIHTSEDIRRFMALQLKGRPKDWTEIRLPDNMFIWATMNSADQGVFSMDTAFKRRWSFEYLGIDENESEVRGRITLGSAVSQDVEWNVLRKAINAKLSKEYRINEDKLMGPFFLSKKVLATVSEEDDTIADTDRFVETFKSKVIMYLYEDAAKQHKHKLFAGCEDTTRYSAVCESFDEIGIQIFGEDFEEAYYNPQRGD